MSEIGRIAKRVALGAAGVVVLGVGALVVSFYVLSPKLRAAPSMTAPTNAEAIERGRYLVANVALCTSCHSPVRDDLPGEAPVEGRLGAGRDFGDMGPDVPMRLRAPNITADRGTGIGAWTDGEIARAIREGVGRQGRPLFPQMPYNAYRETLGDGEILDIIAYLRTLPAIENDAGTTTVSFPVSMFVRSIPKPLTTSPSPAPSPSDKLARGRWLLTTASCTECHDSVNGRMEKLPGKALGGGMKFSLGAHGYAIAPNISSDKATGIGAYSDEDLMRVLDEGKGKSGRMLFVMPWSGYRGLTREDKLALIAALREAAPVANVVAPSAVKL